jgi:hypothetical protein
MIKSFESFSSAFPYSDYYTQISKVEYDSLKIRDKLVDINNDIINIIKDNSKVKFDTIKNVTPFDVYTSLTRPTNRPIDERKGIYLNCKLNISGQMPPDQTNNYLEKTHQFWIWELKDEWFLVNHQEQVTSGSKFWNQNRDRLITWYKCDQLDGLMKLLNNLIHLNERKN